ncbi:hypothetical protein D3C75_895300 [compost metagenome]
MCEQAFPAQLAVVRIDGDNTGGPAAGGMPGKADRFRGRITARSNPDRKASVRIINAKLRNLLTLPRVKLVELPGGSQEEQAVNAFADQAVD